MPPFILTAGDIRAALNLTSTEFDPLIETGIATVGIDLECRYNRSLRVGEAPDGSRDFFLSRVVAWAKDQPDIMLAAVREAGVRADGAIADLAKPLVTA